MKSIKTVAILLVSISLLTASQTYRDVNTLNMLVDGAFSYTEVENEVDNNIFDYSELYVIQFDSLALDSLHTFLASNSFKHADVSDKVFFIKRISDEFEVDAANLESYKLYRGDFKKVDSACKSNCSVYFLVSKKYNKAYIEFINT